MSFFSLAGGHLLLEDCGVTKFLTLNRPGALNALSWSMVRSLRTLYQTWSTQSQRCVVVLRSSCPRAFSAGGDVVAISTDTPRGTRPHYFKDQYCLNYTIGTLSRAHAIPHLALLDGITMGGGAGLAMHGSHRVCTENTVFAMPECAIGHFPDSGASLFLPRVKPLALGRCLGLTGRRLYGRDVITSGLGTHFVPRARLPELVESLRRVKEPAEVDGLITSYHEPVNAPTELQEWSPSQLQCLHRAFCDAQTVEDALNALSAEPTSEFVDAILQSLLRNAPLSVKVTWEMFRRVQSLPTPQENFRLEYRLSQGFLCRSPDFDEGVRAQLREKTKDPRWVPSALADVSDTAVQNFFDTVPEDGDLDVDSQMIDSSSQDSNIAISKL